MKRWQYLVFVLFYQMSFFSQAWGSDRTYLVCYHKDPSVQEPTWSWGLDELNKYYSITGYWIKDVFGQSFFLADQANVEDLRKCCIDTIAKQLIDGSSFVRAKASNSGILADYPIVHLKGDRSKSMNEIHGEMRSFVQTQFLPWAQSQFESFSQKQLITQAIFKRIQRHPKDLNRVTAFRLRGEKYEEQPPVWKAKDPLEMNEEFLKQFEKTTDFEILSYSLLGSDGIQSRGLFNSFVDLTTSSFVPFFQKPNNDSLQLFDLTHVEHVRLLAFSKVFSVMTALKGQMERIEKYKADEGKVDAIGEFLEHYLDLADKVKTALSHLKVVYLGNAEGLKAIDNMISQLDWSYWSAAVKQ